MKKILLAEPLIKYPIKKQKDGKLADIGVRINLAYLAGYLRDNSNNYEPSIKPYRFEEFLGKKRNLKQDLYGIDYVGITASSSEYPDALEIAKEAKRHGATVIMGGIYPSANYEDVLRSGYVDYVVIGEGEDTLMDLLNTIEDNRDIAKVQGIAYINDSKIIRNCPRPLIKDLDSVRPAYDLLPMENYVKYLSAPIYSARGCFGNCEFCTVSKHWNSTYRARSVQNILEEVRLLKSYGFKTINFKDESLTLDRKQAESLFDALAEANLGLKYKGKTRIDDIDEGLLDKMKAANFQEIHFGIETLNEETLRNIQKDISRDEILSKVEMMLNKGFVINPSIILGNPGDTKESLKELSDFIKSIYQKGKVKVYTCLNTPHPGSFQRINAAKRGLDIISDNLDKYTHFHLVSVPRSLGDRQDAVRAITEVQKDIVTSVNGPEPLISISELLNGNIMGVTA